MKALPGTYALVLRAREGLRISVGRLGPCEIRPGYYVYVGSAFGPGGIRARIGHHSRTSSRPRWHIDYLRRVLPLVDVWYTHDSQRREGAWARVLPNIPGFTIAIDGFGATDSPASSHLFRSSSRPSLTAFARHLVQSEPNHADVYRSSFGRNLE